MSTEDSTIAYATWTRPGTPFEVEYSLPLFHEIDFYVNEGYRRIPHGGIELGGLLFGHGDSDGVRIEAYRPIECEHASGPSFKLSERDLDALRKQIESAPTQAEVSGLQVVGWFIAHTRSELVMNDMEAAVLNDLLPGLEKITMLVKPEKFKSTRFTFLMRGADGTLERNGADRSFVLPLAGRAGRREAAAEQSKPVYERPPLTETPPPDPVPADPVSIPPTPSASLFAVPMRPVRETPVHVEPVPISHVGNEPVPITPISEPAYQNTSPTSVRIERRQTERRDTERRRIARSVRIQTSGSRLQFAFILLLAGLLGCGIGYWTYLQLPSPVVPLRVERDAQGFAVSWPADITRDATYVAMRVNDGEPEPVSPEAKTSGRSEINAAGDEVKVELIVRHWFRDSRGIVRFIGAR